MSEEIPEILRPSPAFFLRHVVEGRTVDEMMRDDLDDRQIQWLRYMYWREQGEDWIWANMVPVSVTPLFMRDYWAFQDDLFKDIPMDELPEALKRGVQGKEIRRVDGAQGAIWSWETHGILRWDIGDGALYHVLLDPETTVPDYVLAILPSTHWWTGYPPAKQQSQAPPSRLPTEATILSAPPAIAGFEAFWAIDSSKGRSLMRTPNAPPQFIASNGGIISIGGYPGQALEAAQVDEFVTAALSLDDNTTAAFAACMIKFLGADGSGTAGLVRMTAADYCDLRQFKKHKKGGYEAKLKRAAREDMIALNNIWVTIQTQVCHDVAGVFLCPVNNPRLKPVGLCSPYPTLDPSAATQ